MNFIENMQQKEGTLTKNEKKVYELIRGDLGRLQHMSLTELSNDIGMAKTTILRFCQKLGYSGYMEFRYDLITWINSYEEKDTQKQQSRMTSVENTYMNAISLIHEMVSESEVRKLVNKIHNCRRLYIAGEINSEVSALQLRYILLMIGIDSVVLRSSSDVKSIDLSINDQDLMIVFSVSAKSGIVAIAKEVRENNGFCLSLITMNPNITREDGFDQVIQLPSLQSSNGSLLESVPVFNVFNEVIAAYLGECQKVE